jgi:NAD-dependent DNA ligase
VIGAAAGKDTILLPYTMASLDKVRYGEGGLGRFLKRQKSNDYIITEKLDGLSALYVCSNQKRKMYLRGDGVRGVDVSFAVDVLEFPFTF